MSLDYCSITDVQNRISSAGVTLRTDDTPPTSYGDTIGEASSYIDQYCLDRYADTEMQTSRWVKHKCADIATFLLCERRGNPPPPGIVRKFQDAIAILEKIHAGGYKIPDIGERKAAVPVMSNMRVIMRPWPRPVVEKTRSTGTVDDYSQNVDPADHHNQGLDQNL